MGGGEEGRRGARGGDGRKRKRKRERKREREEGGRRGKSVGQPTLGGSTSLHLYEQGSTRTRACHCTLVLAAMGAHALPPKVGT